MILIQIWATGLTAVSKLLQIYYPYDFGLSGKYFWMNHFILESCEISVQAVNIAVLVAPEMDIQIMLLSCGLLGLNFVVTPLLISSRNVFVNKTGFTIPLSDQVSPTTT